MKIALVGCGKSKLDRAAPARELYTGNLFAAARAWAETFADRWFVLSAKYGLVDPDTVIEPYDLKLSSLSREERERWAEWTSAQVREIAPDDDTYSLVIGLAGGDYLDALQNYGNGLWRWRMKEPLERKEIGERLAWFKRSTLAGHAIRRMQAAEAEGAFGRVELSAAECSAIFSMGLTWKWTPSEIFARLEEADQPASVGEGVQLSFLEAA